MRAPERLRMAYDEPDTYDDDDDFEEDEEDEEDGEDEDDGEETWQVKPVPAAHPFP